jgi:serine/threonine protein kinase
MTRDKAQDFLELIGFEVITPLNPIGYFGAVYLAKKGGRRLAVKLPLNREWVDDKSVARCIHFYGQNIAHLEREHEANVRAYGIKGVPSGSEREFYSSFFEEGLGVKLASPSVLQHGVVVIFRDYIEGVQMGDNQRIEKSYQRALEQTVRECHLAGIANLDIERKNTILSSRGRPSLIDFGRAVFREDVKGIEFEGEMKDDFRKLRELY